MPKLVDHEERRRSIVAAAWRLIARRGLDGVTMRDLAAETGYANGALAHYFSGKDEIVRVAFEHVLSETNERIRESVQGLQGVVALRRMCREIMPLASETRLEARIAIALWQRALNDVGLAAVNNAALDLWRAQLAQHWREAIALGELQPIDVETRVEILMTMLVGLQVTVALERGESSTEDQMVLLDNLLGYDRD